MMKSLLATLAAVGVACSAFAPAVSGAEAVEPATGSDVIAKVGDQPITFNQINTMLNSSGVVGISVPALGTPERDTARIAVLDKVISANLLYLDALKQGLDKDPGYQGEVNSFSRGMLANLYRERYLAGAIPVTDEEVQMYYKENISPETELSDELRIQIEATLRKRKLQQRLAAERDQLRDGLDVTLYQGNFSPEGDAQRSDDAPVAEAGAERITWGETKDRLIAAGNGATATNPLAMETDARLNALQGEIDTRILAQKARAAGLDQDPVYRSRVSEFQKTRLINLHRTNLARDMEPSEKDLKAYYEKNRDRIVLREMRKVQEVVLDNEEDAKAIKAKIENGELTMYQAASQHSIAPGAKQNLGEIGWVTQGRAQPALDELIFALGPDEVGGPVQSSAGWHLVKIQDVKAAEFDKLDDAATRKRTRRQYVHEQLDAYLVELRRTQFEVQVYEDNLVRLAQQEADMVKRLAEQAQQPSSVTHQRIEELQKLINPPR